MNVIPVCEVLHDMAVTLDQAAMEIRRLEERVRIEKNFDRISTVPTIITNCLNNCRLDLLITRPLREFEYNNNRKGD
jgi:hypothetical protein